MKVLKAKGIEIQRIKAKQSKISSITHQLQSFAFKDPELKYLGQKVSTLTYGLSPDCANFEKAFVSYMKSVYLQKDKSIFKLDQLPAEKFAESLGLPGAPKIKFLDKGVTQKKKNAPLAVQQLSSSAESGGEDPSSEDDDTKPDTRQHKPVGQLCHFRFGGSDYRPAKCCSNEIRSHVRKKKSKYILRTLQ